MHKQVKEKLKQMIIGAGGGTFFCLLIAACINSQVERKMIMQRAPQVEKDSCCISQETSLQTSPDSIDYFLFTLHTGTGAGE